MAALRWESFVTSPWLCSIIKVTSRNAFSVSSSSDPKFKPPVAGTISTVICTTPDS
jgi:hypothetical protein